MIGILLVWLAFSPVQPVPVRAPAPQKVTLQPQTQNTVIRQKSVVPEPVTEHIRSYLTRKTVQGAELSLVEGISFRNRLARFYAARGYRPVWIKRTMITELITAIESAADDGLDPADYHIRALRVFYNQPPQTPQQEANCDLLLSDAFLTLATHLRYGKVDPVSLDPNWNINDFHRSTALEYRLQNAVTAERIAAVLAELRPQHSEYLQLRKGLIRNRALAKDGGWPVVPDLTGLKEGVTDNRVLPLRKRLVVSGDMTVTVADTARIYDKRMVEAVKRFQKRNGMVADGVPGPATFRAMNLPVERRIEQIRINMERCRWFMNDLEPTYIMVNIAEFSLRYVEHGRNRWGTRVIVGQPYRETPVFKADMQYIVFNPRWVVPPTILSKDVLPAIRKNSAYLSRKKLNILDRNGAVVSPASVNWSQYTGANFPYRLQQTAGDHGALGRIKFMLPNRHTVYLHDTPTKDLFEKSSRTFSSGCIRVENPQELARLVLQDSLKWSRERIQAAINSGKTATVYLPKRIPVFILYLTAFAEGDEIVFLDDVYNRDSAVLKALDKPLPQL
ncbi:L,D-transpeptidase family protein [Chlorobium sp. BLA1]|uniref:L,D-transpeptidase family protein n=1 Tax=Candidatus Chlorobium masyuteum TaxID=2716876 RepID=UPI00141DF6E0|nr:L,D-transpeptidase family protein [Candidatus Chlorobium masyuteum]NHQ59977.1 L,D-transpeptidase family protein [Candidatus Chlorobium masyuteum]